MRWKEKQGLKKEMTKRERVMAAVKGAPVDRAPLSFFGHNHVVERSTDTLVKHLLEQNSTFGWDFMKIQLPNTYYGEAWGCEYRWDPTSSPTKGWITVEGSVKKKEDLYKIKQLNPREGILGEELKVTTLLKSLLKEDIPKTHTIFTPLTVLKRLTGTELRTSTEVTLTRQLMKEAPDAVHQALGVISNTLAEYAREAIRSGADGIFMTTTVWSLDTISEEEYKIFGIPYDLPIYQAAIEEGATLNILHLCRENIMLDLLSGYPVEIISYDAKARRNPPIKEAMRKTDKAIWGGLDHVTTLVNGPVSAISDEVHEVLNETKARRVLLGPGCSIPPQTPAEHLHAVKDAIYAWNK
jgi:uroporphyrinogen decarboxylase